MKLNFSNDLGYGSIKGRINGKLIKVPSIISMERPEDISDPITFDNKTDEDSYLKNYLNHMDVSVQSSSINKAGRYLVGQNANNSREEPQAFDVNNMAGKSDSDLSVILTLSTVAGTALAKYFNQYHKLPKNGIKVDVNMVTALPILEGARNKTLDYYAKRYTACDHIVNIRNFNTPISIKIHFSHVLVRLEGQVAVYNIRHADKSLANNISKDFKAHYPKMYKLVHSREELTKDPNTLSVDIGEGTTDFAVFNNGKVNIEASSSIPTGYGNVLESAVRELQQKGYSVTNRAGIKASLNQPTNFSNANKKSDYQKAIKENLPQFVQQIRSALSASIRNAKGHVDIIYVYGGGAIPMAKSLRKPLMIETRASNGGNDIPVVFLNKDHAQYMNVDGLELILNSLLH